MNSADHQLISLESASQITRQLSDQGLLDDHDTSFIVFDFSRLDQKLNLVKETFPSFWKHAVATKANPLAKVLEHIGLSSFGSEAASFEEVWLAQKANAPFIIWDSPAKTPEEISKTFKAKSNVIINANSLDELKELCSFPPKQNIKLGLRINPEMSLSSMSSMTVGSVGSKFGEPISNARAVDSFIKSSKIKIGLHIHASSQNNNLEETASAIKKLCKLASEIGLEQIAYIDIGGGFPADYGFENTVKLTDYSSILKKECPILFDQSIEVYTEFGRFYHANAGFHISKINEVKTFSNQQTLTHHLGADMFLRESYQPGKWSHRFGIMDAHFVQKRSLNLETAIGGPLCFGGDYIAKNVMLPEASRQDYLIIMDTGANSFALWSMHCSRTFPKVIGIDSSGHPFILKERQRIEEIAQFWS